MAPHKKGRNPRKGLIPPTDRRTRSGRSATISNSGHEAPAQSNTTPAPSTGPVLQNHARNPEMAPLVHHSIRHDETDELQVELWLRQREIVITASLVEQERELNERERKLNEREQAVILEERKVNKWEEVIEKQEAIMMERIRASKLDPLKTEFNKWKDFLMSQKTESAKKFLAVLNEP